LPTHRVLARLPEFDAGRLLDQLKERFSILPLAVDPASPDAMSALVAAMQRHGQTQPTFGLVVGAQGGGAPARLWVLTANEPVSAQLDVRILQSEIFETLLHLQEESAVANGQLRYVKDAGQAARQVLSGDAQLACLLNPTPIDAIETIARSGGRMPRKTTYFLPKPLTGFVLYPVDPGALPTPLTRA